MKKEYNALHQRHTEVGAARPGRLLSSRGAPAEPAGRGPHAADAWSLHSASSVGALRAAAGAGGQRSHGPVIPTDDPDLRGAH